MFLTKLLDTKDDDYIIHKKIKTLFPGEQKVLFQRSGGFITVLSEKNSETHPSKEITNLTDNQYLFSIRLNPVINRNKGPRKVPDLKKWIENKLNIPDTMELIPSTLSYSKECRVSLKNDNKISLHSVFVTGALRVINKENLFKVYQTGIGHAKGLGFGFLNLF